MATTKYDLCIIGGAGHIGLPLGIAFANAGVRTVLLDVNEPLLKQIEAGEFPFREEGGERELRRALKKGTLSVALDPQVITKSDYVTMIIGTPIDEYLNPHFNAITNIIDNYLTHFRDNHVFILRSTVFPGTTERVQRYFLDKGKKVQVAFCPERVIEGKAFQEFKSLPQIVTGFDKATTTKVANLFKKLKPPQIVVAHPIEAELAKLYSNAWRYITFAAANQFFMIADSHNLDYHRIYEIMTNGYPRNKDLPKPGFAAGPCLRKDTMQLAAFSQKDFSLGYHAMLVNEGLPNYLFERLKLKHGNGSEHKLSKEPLAKLTASLFAGDNNIRHALRSKTLGILGMAFKGESDDRRDSLSYKVKKVGEAECKEVLCHDFFVEDPSFVPLAELIKRSDIVILGAPHKGYKEIDPREYPGKQFIDIWNFWPSESKAKNA